METTKTFPLEGVFEESYLSGTIDYENEVYLFEAILFRENMNFTMFNIDEYGQLIYSSIQTLDFKRSDGVPSSTTKTTTSQKQTVGLIYINGHQLTIDEIDALKQQYGVEPLSGNYWYDQVCGLYGVVGYAAFGFMYPGHNFGGLDRNASNGNTNVVVNGRELNQEEYNVWSYILGYWIQAGTYWMDAKGNAGYEGSSAILVNFYTAAQNNCYTGAESAGGGDNDNFWSTKFSAGNSDQGGSRGYVSVPGYGPIGFGF